VDEYPSRNRGSQSGFTLIELMIVVIISVVLAAITVPKFMTFVHNVRLQGAGSDFAGLLQQARIHAVQDDNYYGTYFSTSGILQVAYVDLSRNGGASVTSIDPLIQISTEVVPTAASSAPDTSNLKGQFLPTGSTLPVTDGVSSTTPIIFNSRGLPCTNITANGGTVCSSGSNNATAFWIFFQDNVTSMWEGVTVSPAGRIQKWRHAGSAWTKM
jgi:prepilin-type N-terminal cleavage/methylation domain-containing protein